MNFQIKKVILNNNNEPKTIISSHNRYKHYDNIKLIKNKIVKTESFKKFMK